MKVTRPNLSSTSICNGHGLGSEQLRFREGMPMKLVDFLTRGNWLVWKPEGNGFFVVGESLLPHHVHPAIPAAGANFGAKTVVSNKDSGSARLSKLAPVSSRLLSFCQCHGAFSTLTAEGPPEGKKMRGGLLLPISASRSHGKMETAEMQKRLLIKGLTV